MRAMQLQRERERERKREKEKCHHPSDMSSVVNIIWGCFEAIRYNRDSVKLLFWPWLIISMPLYILWKLCKWIQVVLAFAKSSVKIYIMKSCTPQLEGLWIKSVTQHNFKLLSYTHTNTTLRHKVHLGLLRQQHLSVQAMSCARHWSVLTMFNSSIMCLTCLVSGQGKVVCRFTILLYAFWDSSLHDWAVPAIVQRSHVAEQWVNSERFHWRHHFKSVLRPT